MHKNVKINEKGIFYNMGIFPNLPLNAIKFPIPRAPGPVPKKAVTALAWKLFTHSAQEYSELV